MASRMVFLSAKEAGLEVDRLSRGDNYLHSLIEKALAHETSGDPPNPLLGAVAVAIRKHWRESCGEELSKALEKIKVRETPAPETVSDGSFGDLGDLDLDPLSEDPSCEVGDLDLDHLSEDPSCEVDDLDLCDVGDVDDVLKGKPKENK